MAKSSPPFLAAAGETIMPARSLKTASIGTKGSLRSSRTWVLSRASTLVIEESSPLRLESFIVCMRSMLNFTASASKGVPSWKVTSSRRVRVRLLSSSAHFHSVASCGTIFRFLSMSTSLSHIAVKISRPVYVPLVAGSSASGSSWMPTFNVAAEAGTPSITAAEAISRKQSLDACIVRPPSRSG